MSRRHIYRGRSRTGIARCTAGRIWRSVLPKSRQLQRERLLKSLGNACDRRSAEMATEEGDEDHDVETDVVEGKRQKSKEKPREVDENGDKNRS